MSDRLAGKVAVVTGGGSGMGAAMAELFHANGARVVVADIAGKQEEVAARLGERCRAIKADVSKSSDVRAMLNLAVEAFGRLDVLCNNAGIQGQFALTADYDEDDWDAVMSVNLRGVFLGMKYAIPHMLATGGGSIINTSSMASIVAFPTLPAYSASKGAVATLTKVTAAEYAAKGIRVNAIQPGAIDTVMARAMTPEIIEGAIAATLMGRIGTPMEVANLALFLASDESSFITGTLTPIDGGYTLV